VRPPSSSPSSPEDALLTAERAALVSAALPTLPPELRAVVHARFFAEDDDAAIARTLGVAPVTVRTRAHRALARLRTLLGGLRGLTPVWLCGSQPAALALLPLALAVGVASGPKPAPAPRPAAVAVPAARATPATPPRAPMPVAPPSSRARPARLPPLSPTEPAAVARYDFDQDEVEGALQRPDEMLQGSPTRTRHASLLEIPSSFTAETVKMIEDL
jgi:hypothetical protein